MCRKSTSLRINRDAVFFQQETWQEERISEAFNAIQVHMLKKPAVSKKKKKPDWEGRFLQINISFLIKKEKGNQKQNRCTWALLCLWSQKVRWFLFVSLFLFFGPHVPVLRIPSWFCDQHSLLPVFREPYLGNEPSNQEWQDATQASYAILTLWPLEIRVLTEKRKKTLTVLNMWMINATLRNKKYWFFLLFIIETRNSVKQFLPD